MGQVVLSFLHERGGGQTETKMSKPPVMDNDSTGLPLPSTLDVQSVEGREPWSSPEKSKVSCKEKANSPAGKTLHGI